MGSKAGRVIFTVRLTEAEAMMALLCSLYVTTIYKWNRSVELRIENSLKGLVGSQPMDSGLQTGFKKCLIMVVHPIEINQHVH